MLNLVEILRVSRIFRRYFKILGDSRFLGGLGNLNYGRSGGVGYLKENFSLIHEILVLLRKYNFL